MPIIPGTPGRDYLMGGMEADTIWGGGDNDSLMGGGGDDLLIGGPGADIIDGGDDDSMKMIEVDGKMMYGMGDTAAYANSDQGVNVYLDEVDNSGETIPQNVWGGHAQGDQLTNIENVTGSMFNDGIGGDAGNNMLKGMGGNDEIGGRAGDDKIYGGSGHDTLMGQAGMDMVMGGMGNDEIGGGMGDDMLEGNMGNDMLMGDMGMDTLWGGMGDDELMGGMGNDVLNGGAGADMIDGGDGTEDALLYNNSSEGVTVDIGAGTGMGGTAAGDMIMNVEWVHGSDHADMLTAGDMGNKLVGHMGDDMLMGGMGVDTLFGGMGADSIGGGDGDDEIIGGMGDDTVDAGGDDDMVSGMEGEDVLRGGAGDDTLMGGMGDDSLNGGADDDDISGGMGDDKLNGESGKDTLMGGGGADTLDGGAGMEDTASYADSAMGVTVDLDPTKRGSGGDAEGDQLMAVENVTGSANDDMITGDGMDNKLVGGGGNDTLDGGAGADSLDGGAGNDMFVGDASGDDGAENPMRDRSSADAEVKGGDGTDTVTFEDLAAAMGETGDTMEGDTFAQVNVTIDGVTVTSTDLSGAYVDLTDDVYDKVENVIGSDHNDAIGGTDDENDLMGGAGNDTIFGGDDDDMIEGGEGADVLRGGEGSDTFVFQFGPDGEDPFDNNAADSITDWGAGGDDDMIDLSGMGITSSTEQLREWLVAAFTAADTTNGPTGRATTGTVTLDLAQLKGSLLDGRITIAGMGDGAGTNNASLDIDDFDFGLGG